MISNWSLNSLYINAKKTLIKGSFIDQVNKRIFERENFSYNESEVTIPRYFYRIIGIEDTEEQYYNYLYEIDKQLKQLGDLYLKIDNGLDRETNGEMIQNGEESRSFEQVFNFCWTKILSLGDFNGAILVQILRNENLLGQLLNKKLQEQVYENTEGLVDYYLEINNEEIEEETLYSLLKYICFWCCIYLDKLTRNFDYVNVNPKILSYGVISIEEGYFYMLLSSLGVDILYFNPLCDDIFISIDKDGLFSCKEEFNRKVSVKKFPKNKIVERVQTITHQAQEELMTTLHTEDSLCYRPWQLSDYRINPITLKSTYLDLLRISKLEGMIRENWLVENGNVYLSNLFCKISGVSANMKDYWKVIHELEERDNVLFKTTYPLFKADIDDCVSAHSTNSNCRGNKNWTDNHPNEYYNDIVDGDEVTPEKIMGCRFWKYGQLRTGLQKNIAEKIAYIINSDDCLQHNSLSQIEIKKHTLKVLLCLEQDILTLLQSFDYPAKVPMILVYSTEEKNQLNFSDAIILLLLNKLGFDIAIFVPTGYNNIENFINTSFYDIYHLEDVSFNLAYKKQSLLKKLLTN